VKKYFFSLLIKFLLFIISMGCALLIAEGFIRLVAPQKNKPGVPGGQLTKSFWKHDDLLGWRQLPNINLSWKGVPVLTNSKGLRDKEYPYERKAGTKRILVLGDSFVWGWGVKADEMFTKIIEAKYNNLEVISMGVPGYSTDQEFLWLKEEGLRYKPDALLLVLEGGDFSADKLFMHDGRYKPMFTLKDDDLELSHVPVPDVPTLRKVHFFLRTYSYLYIFLYKRELTKAGKLVYEKIVGKPLSTSTANVNLKDTPGKPVAGNSKVDNKFIITSKILEKMDELCKKQHMKFIVANHFVIPEMSALVNKLATEKGFYFIDLDQALTKFAKENPNREIRLGEADVHWNPLGHKIVAEAIANHLEKYQILP
jgi:hypothetical protein